MPRGLSTAAMRRAGNAGIKIVSRAISATIAETGHAAGKQQKRVRTVSINCSCRDRSTNRAGARLCGLAVCRASTAFVRSKKAVAGGMDKMRGRIRAPSSALREMPREHLLMSVSGQGGTNPSIVSATRMFFASRVGRFSLVSRKLQAPSAFLFALRSWPLKARSWHLTKYLRR